ncbi:DUF397 domain-containing protein [Streptomyces morookaense]|uniref:DUF397 domain-containing protein n=1 Tax=Streptomyces morookaense TaxID=1970 RepID=A0A7Y7E9B6_STRMO|nr:DUF397 domain-containing protein [Streptomyces morookaense]NVK80252.1 DUF397 domain-containing protein [Streptomyces morookaense]GHF40271.1 transcriptional regulator [Streptomyces morookaense]
MVFDNGVPAAGISGVEWIKSRASMGGGNCVELAKLPNGAVAMRNSRHPEGPALVYTREEVAAFLDGAKKNEFDHLMS